MNLTIRRIQVVVLIRNPKLFYAMKRIAYFVVATLVAAVSCSKEVNPVVDNDQPVVEDNQPVSTVKKISFTAYADNGDETRTSLNVDNSVTWAAGEAIYVFFDGKAPRKFVSTNTEPAKVVTFEGEADTEATTYYAVSPAATMSGSTITATIPVFQTATAGTFDPKAAISVAVSGTDPNDPTALKFKNAAAAVKFQIRNNDVTKIRLEAINGEKLAGKATITLDSDNIPHIQMVESDAESCVILTGAFVANTDYVIAVAPGTYSGGFRLTLFNADGKYASIANTNSQTLGRSDLMNFGTMPAVTTWKEGTLTTLFTETFDGTDGTGGHDGQYTGTIGEKTPVYDNEGLWGDPDHCGGAYHCLKFGTNNNEGSFYVDGLTISETAVLTFSAAGWGSGDNNYLLVDVEGATASGNTEIALSNGEWKNYTVTISNVIDDVTISFFGKRGFLDDIKLDVMQGGGPVDPEVVAPIFEINDQTPANGTIVAAGGSASFVIHSTLPWVIDAENEASIPYTSSTNGDFTTVTATFGPITEGSRSLTFTVTPSEGDSEVVTFTQVFTGGGTEQTIFLETFGSTSSTPSYSSYSGYTATASMFTGSGTVSSHYSGSGSIGKNNYSAVNLSSGYSGASGNSGCFHQGTANTQATILQISGIDISGCSGLALSFGALGGSSSHKISVSYKIDNGSETALITNGSITNANWTLLSANIPDTGNSLTLIFKHTPTKQWTIRMDDIKVVGTK